MPKKATTPDVKVVDYRSVNLAWLIEFNVKLCNKAIAPEVTLVVAQEDASTGTGTGRGSSSKFEVHKGDTLCVTGETETSYSVTRPYADVRSGELARSVVSIKPRQEWSTEDVAEYVIKRACLKDECIYLEVIEEPKKNVSETEYKGTFVSQARKSRFSDLVGALQYFFKPKKIDVATQYVWLDIFCANQPKLTARNIERGVRKANEKQLTEGLHVAIANFDRCVMFMDKWDTPTPLTRAWCVWEVFGVAKAGKTLEVALHPKEFFRLWETAQQNPMGINKAVDAAVDVKKAQCFNPDDLLFIRRKIKKAKLTNEALDAIIRSQLRAWIDEMMRSLYEMILRPKEYGLDFS